MLILYNILLTLAVILLFPLIFIYIALKSKYRVQIPKRLGWGLKDDITSLSSENRRIWVHALSVGEVTSALPLVAKLKEDFADTTIIFSASTKTGYDLSKTLLSQHCDTILPFPVDLLPVTKYFIHLIKPNLFILVETDFWPNLLSQLQKKRIPSILVNGRISKQSIDQYIRFSFFFKPMFMSFSHICVQSEQDKTRLLELGLDSKKIHKLGNLKYEPVAPAKANVASKLLNSNQDPLFIAGSTHRGEEEILLETFLELRRKYALRMIIAPRNIKRAKEIETLANSLKIDTQLRTSEKPFITDLYILDTIGELSAFYGKCDICFVGGSLVDEGGHNPLEPASQGKPVLFGPHMTDFSEICDELIASNGGFQVSDKTELAVIIAQFLDDSDHRSRCGEAAKKCITSKKGLLEGHLQLIREIL